MNTITIPFDLPGFQIEQVTGHEQLLTIHATSILPLAICSHFGTASHSVHSRYARHPQDVPLAEYAVQLVLHVRRWRCSVTTCAAVTFSESLPTLIPSYGRSEVAVRLTPPLPRPVSGDTLLRWIQREPLPSPAAPRIIGVDEWAYRKGQRYGTLIVDLECRRPSALLPDRTVETVAAWLSQHPQIELVTRDSAPDYARAIADGAPQAIQVANRWHLMANLRETS